MLFRSLDFAKGGRYEEEIKNLIQNADKIRADYLARQTQPTIVAKHDQNVADSGRQYS